LDQHQPTNYDPILSGGERERALKSDDDQLWQGSKQHSKRTGEPVINEGVSTTAHAIKADRLRPYNYIYKKKRPLKT
jgi:hypothetical protein